MRILFFFFFVLATFVSNGQDIRFVVRGDIKYPGKAKFVYLSTLSQQVSISSDRLFMVVPILNGSFEFRGNIPLEGRHYQYACLFLSDRGNISKDELALRFRQHIWVTGVNSNIRLMILEDIKYKIMDEYTMNISEIVEGGILTRQVDARDAAIFAGCKMLTRHIGKYPDSQLSFDIVKEVTEMMSESNKSRIETLLGSPSAMFDLLSPRFKKSKTGVALKKLIDEKLKE